MVQPDGVNFRVQTSIGDSLGLVNVFSEVYGAAHLQAAGVAVKSNHRCRFYYSSAATICEMMHGGERRQKTALLITLWRKCGPTPGGGLRSALSEEHQPSPSFQSALTPAHFPFCWFPSPSNYSGSWSVQPLITHRHEKEQFLFYGSERDVSVSITLQIQKLWLMAVVVIALYTADTHADLWLEKEMKPFFLCFI